MKTEKYNQSVKDYYNRLLRFVFKTIRDSDASKDIVQESFLKLWQEMDKINEAKIKTWLFTVAHNMMINYVKRENKSVGMEGAGLEKMGAQCGKFEMQEIIDKGLEDLSEVQRSLILLRDLEGYDYKEIGKIMNLTEDQVRVSLFRARQKVKNKIRTLSVIL